MFASFQAAMAPGHNAGYQQGLYKRTYSGYYSNVKAWFTTATLTATNKVVGSINMGSIPTTTTYEFVGYFKAPYAEAFTFSLNSDDLSYLWIGDNALYANYTNAVGSYLVSATAGFPSSGTTAVLQAGKTYPFRLQVGNNGGPGLLALSVSSISLASTSDLTALGLYNPNTLGI